MIFLISERIDRGIRRFGGSEGGRRGGREGGGGGEVGASRRANSEAMESNLLDHR